MMVGIYFKVADDFLIDAVQVDAGEAYGDAVGHGGHYDYHENLKPMEPSERRFKAHSYDYYPRGRVVFFPEHNAFTLYTDPCLTVEDVRQIKGLFGLDGQAVNVAADEHYRCAKCNRFFIE